MAVSDPLPHIVLIGGDGGPSGVPRHMLHLANSLQTQAKVTVISDQNTGGFSLAADLGAQHLTILGLQTRKSLSHLWGGWRGLTRFLRSTDADLIWLHARMPVLMGRVALALRVWRPRRRVAVTLHGLPFGPGHKPRNSRISETLEKTLLSLCPPLDLVFLSQQMADRMADAMGAQRMVKHRVHILPNCSDLGPLPIPKRGGRKLIMTGRAGWQKNYPLAAQILSYLPENYSLTLCGAGTDDPEFQRDITNSVTSDVATRIHFAGPLQDVRGALMSADGYLLCSRYEGLPIGTLEAFEAGLPVILSRFDGAEALAATSPYACVLDFVDLAADAKEIDALMSNFQNARDDPRMAIQESWQTLWSPQVFANNSRALLRKLLT